MYYHVGRFLVRSDKARLRFTHLLPLVFVATMQAPRGAADSGSEHIPSGKHGYGVSSIEAGEVRPGQRLKPRDLTPWIRYIVSRRATWLRHKHSIPAMAASVCSCRNNRILKSGRNLHSVESGTVTCAVSITCVCMHRSLSAYSGARQERVMSLISEL